MGGQAGNLVLVKVVSEGDVICQGATRQFDKDVGHRQGRTFSFVLMSSIIPQFLLITLVLFYIFLGSLVSSLVYDVRSEA